MRNIKYFFLVLALGLIAASIVPLSACSVPVFRYALERWDPSPYELLVLTRGPLAHNHQDAVRRFAQQTTNLHFNLNVRVLDLATNVPSNLTNLAGAHPLPSLALRYPMGTAATVPAWSGPLDATQLERLANSPIRQQIVRKLSQGHSAVWLLLESGDARQDEAARRLLEQQLAHQQNTLQLPKLVTDDVAGGNTAAAEEDLKPVFSVLRIQRNDPAESAFIQMLLGSEEDLADAKAPMAFPVFGRGRLLFALLGDGINTENIAEACAFLVGPCSCVVKEQNPGVDLLLAADWDTLITERITKDPELPELTSLATIVAPQPTNAASLTNTVISSQPPQIGGASSATAKTRVRLAWFALGGFGLLCILGGVIVLLGKPR